MYEINLHESLPTDGRETEENIQKCTEPTNGS